MTLRLGAPAALLGGALAAVGASLCCVVPLLLVMLGVSGAWIATLTRFEPLRPLFIALALLFLGLAFRRLYLVPPACAPDEACADPHVRRRQRAAFWIASVLLVGLIAAPWAATLFYRY